MKKSHIYKALFLLLFFNYTSAQINIQDSLVANTAYWMLHDDATYDVYYVNTKVIENDSITLLNKRNIVTMKIVDSTNISYDIEWTYHKTDEKDVNKNKFQIKFQTDEFGSFKKWLNKLEVLKELQNDNYPYFIQNEKKFIETLVIAQTLKPNEVIYEVLENYLLINIFHYLNFSGGSYPMNQLSWVTIEIENPINKKKMESSIISEVEYFEENHNTYILTSTTQPNQADLNSFLKEIIKINDDHALYYNEIKNRSLFHNSGWLIQNEIENKMTYNNEVMIKNIRFEMWE